MVGVITHAGFNRRGGARAACRLPALPGPANVEL
jgi:hypothetical protein